MLFPRGLILPDISPDVDDIVWNGLTTVIPEDDSGDFDDLLCNENYETSMTLEYNEDFTQEFWGMLFGGPDPKSPAFAMQIKSLVCPFSPPRKMRGLTGKAYRIARRRYHREMRAWRRGLIPSVETVQVFYDVRPMKMIPVPGRPDEVSVEFSIH